MVRALPLLVVLAPGCGGLAPSGTGPGSCDEDGDGAVADRPSCVVDGEAPDCDDADADRHPGALELCDGLDNDCSGVPDDGADADGDGSYTCFDCDDTDPSVHPGAEDVCDGIDNDCSGGADEAYDADGDGFSPCGGDCDDADPRRSAGLPEVCNGIDDDCDGAVDEGFDADGDGWLTCRGDCDDTNPSVYYGAPEACDGLDDDCDGAVDEVAECWGCVGVHGWTVCVTPAPADDALALCAAYGLSLGEVYTAEESVALGIAVNAVGAAPAWIGATDDGDEGAWRWRTGATMHYTAWAAGQPDDDGGEDCAVIGADGTWADQDCDQARAFTCR